MAQGSGPASQQGSLDLPRFDPLVAIVTCTTITEPGNDCPQRKAWFAPFGWVPLA